MMGGRSTVEALPPEIREAVQAAIREGATIAEIVERVRELGGTLSRSAAGRYAKRARDLVKRQKEADRVAEIWVQQIGEQPEGRTGRLAIETLRTLAMYAAMDLSDSGESVDPEEIGTLALAMRRIEAAGKTTTDREITVAREATRKAAERADKSASALGLTADTAAAIRAAIEGGAD